MYRRDLRDADYDPLLAEMAVADAAVQAVPSPDGDRVAHVTEREDRTDVWLAGEDGDRRLTGGGAMAQRYNRADPRFLDWHPSGEAVVYADEEGDLRTADVATGAKTRVTSHDAVDSMPRFGPDGESIAFVSGLWSPGSLGVASPDGSRLECLCDDEFLYYDPRWAADALYASRSRHRDLGDYETELVRVSTDGDCEVVYGESAVRAVGPRPRPGSAEVAFTHDGSGYDAVYVAGPDGEVEELFAVDGAEVYAHDWDDAGDRLAVTVTDDGDVQVWTVTRDGDAERVSDERGLRYPPAWAGDRLVSVLSRPSAPPTVYDETAGERVAATAPVDLGDRLVEPEAITFESDDGLDVHAMVYLPEGAEDAEPDSVPLVVHPHGGPTSYDGFGWDYRSQYFAALGYALVLPNYRGSDGFGRRFRNRNDRAWGRGDLDDVVVAADALADRYEAVDGDRAGIFGGSGGGLMTVNALGRSERFDAGAAFYGVYDYETFADDTDDIGWRLMKRELGYPATDYENYRDASPIEAVEDVDAPLLVLHGEEDARVPISQSEQLVEALEANGKLHEFHRYEGEPHGFSRRENVVDAYTRVADLFAKYLRVDPDDGSSRPHPPE